MSRQYNFASHETLNQEIYMYFFLLLDCFAQFKTTLTSKIK